MSNILNLKIEVIIKTLGSRENKVQENVSNQKSRRGSKVQYIYRQPRKTNSQRRLKKGAAKDKSLQTTNV